MYAVNINKPDLRVCLSVGTQCEHVYLYTWRRLISGLAATQRRTIQLRNYEFKQRPEIAIRLYVKPALTAGPPAAHQPPVGHGANLQDRTPPSYRLLLQISYAR